MPILSNMIHKAINTVRRLSNILYNMILMLTLQTESYTGSDSGVFDAASNSPNFAGNNKVCDISMFSY